jgi:hypothetical protein
MSWFNGDGAMRRLWKDEAVAAMHDILVNPKGWS